MELQDMIKQWERERRVRQKMFGKNTARGALATFQIPYYEKKLAEARSWLETNPQNAARRREVAYLEKELKYWKEINEVFD